MVLVPADRVFNTRIRILVNVSNSFLVFSVLCSDFVLSLNYCSGHFQVVAI